MKKKWTGKLKLELKTVVNDDKITMTILSFLHLRQLVDWSGEFEVLWEELTRMGVHELVSLSYCYIRNSRNVANFLLWSLVIWRLLIAIKLLTFTTHSIKGIIFLSK